MKANGLVIPALVNAASHGGRPVVVWGVVSVSLWMLFVVATLPFSLGDAGMADFRVYWRAGQAILNGLDPYAPAPMPYIYPPAFAIAVAPLSLVPMDAAMLIWYMLSLILLVAGCDATVRLVARMQGSSLDHRVALSAMMTVAFLFFPVWASVKLGQVATLLFCLVAGSLLLLVRGRPIVGGVLLGMAIAFKVTPFPLVAYALWVGWYRFALSASITFFGLQLLPEILHPGLSTEYWLAVFPAIGDINETVNMAPMSLAGHLLPQWKPALSLLAPPFAAAVTLIPFALAARGRARLTPFHGAALLIATSVVAGPLVLAHYLVWLLLPIWMLLVALLERGSLLHLGQLGVTLLLLSQPYRMARFILLVLPLPLSSELLGAAILELGAVLLCLLLVTSQAREVLSGSRRFEPVVEVVGRA